MDDFSIGKFLGFVGAALAVVLGLIVVFGSWYTINAQERGVLLRNGAFVKVVEPGLGFKLPWFDSVNKVPLMTFKVRYEKMSSYSKDQQPALMIVTANVRVKPSEVAKLFIEYGGIDGWVDRILNPTVPSQTKIVFGRFNAVTAIQNRGQLNHEVNEAIITATAHEPVLVEQVQLENIDFSQAYEHSIEQRMLAEVEVQKVRQNAEREKVQAEIQVIQATARATANVAEAKGRADATRLAGDAEAAAIKAKGDALAKNPGLVALTQAERWNGVLPTTMLPGNSVPMLSLGSIK